MKREKYEWANIWWEEADNPLPPRVLLIGDSIARDYRKGVQELLRGEALVDSLTTSKAVDDPAFALEVAYMLSMYPYAAIHFNNGLHGQHMDLDAYAVSYGYIVNMLLAKCGNVVLATSTPVHESPGFHALGERNAQVVARNAVVEDVARKTGLAVNDLYAPMAPRADWKKDGSHFKDAGIAEQARLVSAAIRAALSANS